MTLLLILAVAPSQVSSLTMFNMTVDTDYKIAVYMDGTSDYINFEVTLPHPSWIGICFGESMI